MIDYVSQWFEIYRRYQEPADILFEIKTRDKTEIIEFPHEMADGVGALHSLAEKYNWIIKSTAVSRTRKIGLFKYFFNCLKFLYWTKPRSENIWPFDFSKTPDTETLQASHSFTLEETTALLTKVKWLEVSLNTYLFYNLNRVLSNHYSLENKNLAWWIPVNMRPDLGLDVNDKSLKKNYVSNFTIDVNSKMDLKDYQNLISKSLQQQKHWATWWWQHLGRYLPEAIIEKIALHNLHSNYYVGAFSNLGEWTCSEQNSNLNFFVNPLLSHPIGASAIIWNGRLNIGLRVYPTFPASQISLNEIVNEWAKS